MLVSEIEWDRRECQIGEWKRMLQVSSYYKVWIPFFRPTIVPKEINEPNCFKFSMEFLFNISFQLTDAISLHSRLEIIFEIGEWKRKMGKRKEYGRKMKERDRKLTKNEIEKWQRLNENETGKRKDRMKETVVGE